MTPIFFKTLWGFNGSAAEAASMARRDGFDGVEGPIPKNAVACQQFVDALAEHDLLYSAEISTTGFAIPDPGSTVQDHLDALEREIERSLPASPLHFTSMAGNDLWSIADSIRFLCAAHAMAQSFGVRIGFETHRSRSLFHPIAAQEILKHVPNDLELTLDLSHWCVVCERLVVDEIPELFAQCARRALHLHLRVGYDQGAQVPDPRVPAYAHPLARHLAWWHQIWDAQSIRGFKRCTMTPEFGPDGYLPIDPRSNQPVADLRELNLWIAERVRSDFNSRPTT